MIQHCLLVAFLASALGMVKQAVGLENRSYEAWLKNLEVKTEAERVQNLANAMLEDGFCIGVFESKASMGLPEDAWVLNSGRSLRAYENWRDLVGNNWERLWTVDIIKGEFDRIVFWLNRSGGLIESEPRDLRITPYFGSRWLLIMRPALDANQRVIPPRHLSGYEKRAGERSWNFYDQSLVDRYPFLNEHNLFYQYDMLLGAICLKWPDDAPDYGYVVHPTELVDDLKLLWGLLEGDTRSAEEVEAAKPRLQTPTGRAVAEEIAKRLRARTP